VAVIYGNFDMIYRYLFWKCCRSFKQDVHLKLTSIYCNIAQEIEGIRIKLNAFELVI
jgi:hypothetical protein